MASDDSNRLPLRLRIWRHRRIVLVVGLVAGALAADPDRPEPAASRSVANPGTAAPALAARTPRLRPSLPPAGDQPDRHASSAGITARAVVQGVPIAGALVLLHDGSGDPPRRARSDLAGRVAFRDLAAGPYELWARGPGVASPLARAIAGGAGSPDIELALGPATAVTGRVIDQDGRGLPAQVLLVPLDQDHLVQRLATDDAGQFALAALPRGRWEAQVLADDHIAPDRYLLDARGERAHIEMALERGAVISGVVVDAAGAPVTGATVLVRGHGAAPGRRPWQAPVGAVALLPAQVRWVHPVAGARQLPGRESRQFGAARDGVRPAECGDGHCGVDVGGARGTVIHAAADGVVTAVVTEIRPRAGRFVAIDHDGGLRSFYMHLDDIRADLRPGQPVRAGEPFATMGRTGVLHSGEHLHFALTREVGGRSWFLDPEPILRQAVVLPESRSLDAHMAAANLTAAWRSDRQAGEATAAPGAAEPTHPALVTSDARGRFRMAGVAPGALVAAAFHPGLAPGSSAPFRVGPGQDFTGLEIQLRAGTIVHGQVRGPYGPLAGARVVAEEGAGESAHPVARAFTDPDGRFTLRPLAGPVTLVVSASGHGALERGVTLEAGGVAAASREERFELARQDAVLSGRVLDPRGLPVSGASIRLTRGSVRVRPAVSGPGGFFLLGDLPRGTYQLEVVAPGYPVTAASADTARSTTIALVQGGGLRLEVRDGHTGRGLPGVPLEARGPGGERARAVTDSRGVAELAPLVTGRWTVSGRQPGYAGARRTAQVTPANGPRAIAQDEVLELRRGATLGGVVRDASGARLAGARVTIGAASAVTDQDGQFRLADVPSGAVVVAIEKDDLRGARSLTLAPGDEIVTLDLRAE